MSITKLMIRGYLLYTGAVIGVKAVKILGDVTIDAVDTYILKPVKKELEIKRNPKIKKAKFKVIKVEAV